jgi:hypothetical protein
MHCIEGGTLLLPRNLLFVIELVIVIAGILMAGNSTYASHSGAECYLNGHRIYVPDGPNYPRQAWAGWGISCRTPKPDTTADPEQQKLTHQSDHPNGVAGGCGNISRDTTVLSSMWLATG